MRGPCARSWCGRRGAARRARRSPPAPCAAPCWRCRDSSRASASLAPSCLYVAAADRSSFARYLGRVGARRQPDPDEDGREADEVKEVEMLVEEDDGEHRPESRQEMDGEAGTVGADRGDALVP